MCALQAVLAVTLCALPKEFTGIFSETPEKVVKNWHLFICVASGLWGGLIIGLITEYYTSNRFQPVKVILFPGFISDSISVTAPLLQHSKLSEQHPPKLDAQID